MKRKLKSEIKLQMNKISLGKENFDLNIYLYLDHI